MQKPWQILAVGFAVLALYLLIVLKPVLAYVFASLALFGIFAAGFIYQPPSDHFSIVLPAVSEGSPLPCMSGKSFGSPYPEAYLFRIELKNMWVLTLMAFVPLAILIWLFGSGGELPSLGGFPPYELTIVPLYVFGSVWFVVRNWLHERKMLKHALMGWAAIEPCGDVVRYYFFDQNGERRGGIADSRHLVIDTQDNIAIGFANANDPDDSKLSCIFLFHRFKLIETRHIPSPPDNNAAMPPPCEMQGT